MTDKEAIDNLKNYIECLMEDYGYYKDIVEFRDSVEHLEKSLKTQQAEIEHQKEKRENQKKELAILNEKQKEFNKLRNTVNSYKGQFKRQQAEIEKKDNKLKDIKNHIKAELKMIDKLYNEVGWAGKEQYDGMKAAYKCVLNIYFENEVETEDK